MNSLKPLLIKSLFAVPILIAELILHQAPARSQQQSFPFDESQWFYVPELEIFITSDENVGDINSNVITFDIISDNDEPPDPFGYAGYQTNCVNLRTRFARTGYLDGYAVFYYDINHDWV